MTGKILYPSTIVDVEGPVIFLAGPIQGAPPWQDEAIAIIHAREPDIHIACPRRPDILVEGDFTEAMYNLQMDWETHFLGRAARRGAILFWLAREQTHHCDRAYAQTTRFELGEWKERARTSRAHVVVGIEEGFTNSRYIRRRLALEGGQVPMFDTLQKTCIAAAFWAISRP